MKNKSIYKYIDKYTNVFRYWRTLPSHISVRETALIKAGNLGVPTLISSNLCRVMWVINAGMLTFFHTNLRLSALNKRKFGSD